MLALNWLCKAWFTVYHILYLRMDKSGDLGTDTLAMLTLSTPPISPLTKV